MKTRVKIKRTKKITTEAGRNEVMSLPESAQVIRKPGTPAKWLTHSDKWTREEFIREVEEVIHMVHGEGAIYDLNTVTALATQMETYILATARLQTEDHITTARNGVTMINQNFKLADAALTKIITLNRELGIDLKSRKPRPKAIDDLDDLLAGPQL